MTFSKSLILFALSAFTLAGCGKITDPDKVVKNQASLDNPVFVGTTKFGQKLYQAQIDNGEGRIHYVYMTDNVVSNNYTSGKTHAVNVTIQPPVASAPSNESEQKRADVQREIEQLDAVMASAKAKRDELAALLK